MGALHIAQRATFIHVRHVNGLDTLRAAAITLVFMYHYTSFVSGEPTFGFASIVGWVGVDLFFVLSGYLIYSSTLGRFDEFLPGVALALLRNLHRPTWQRITGYGQRTLALGTVTTGATLFAIYLGSFIDDHGYRSYIVCLGFYLVAIAFAILLLAALSPASWLCRLRLPGAYHLALWSYSIYLSHKAVAFIVNTHIAEWMLPPGVKPLLIACACVAAGWLLFRWVETPFMTLRSRRFPTSFSTRDGEIGAERETGS